MTGGAGGGGPRGLLREVEGVGRGSERVQERLVRSIEEDRAIGSAGRLREESEGGRRGSRNYRYEDGITRGPLASTR